MAKQTGIFKIEGTLDETTFYRTKDGDLVRKKGGVNGDRIKSDPAFARTRENAAEFKNAAQAGKQMRHAFSTFVGKSADGRVTSRLMQRMSKIKNLDTTNARGERNVATGIATAGGKALLNGFNFNKAAILDSVLQAPITVDLAAGKVDIDFVPGSDLTAPATATHYSIQAAFGKIDFAAGVSTVELSNAISGTIDNTPVTGNLTMAVPTGTGIKVMVLHVEFLQQINGNLYSLKNGAYNGLGIVEVA